MRIAELHLSHFRNYAQLDADFADGVNVLLGNNAQGKTNLLEAIYVLALTKSHRTVNNGDLIEWKQTSAQLNAVVDKAAGPLNLALGLSKQGKRARVNHIEQAKLSTYVGQLNVILFAPEDLSIVKGAPQVRRRFMDIEFGQMSSQYLYNTARYQGVLKQRNKYLKQLMQRQATDRVYLEVLSDQLAEYGAKVIFQRLTLLKQLEKWASEVHQTIAQQKEQLSFHYATSLPKRELTSVETIQAALQAGFKREADRELRMGTTVLGPHRDDLKFKINGKDVQTFGSQGQQRSVALSVKLAEIDLMKQETGEYPVLLLDDVLSELDDSRQTHLLRAIQDKVQTFLTTTSLNGITKDLVHDPKVFHVANGELTVDK